MLTEEDKKDRQREYHRSWNKKNPGKRKIICDEWRIKNPERHRENEKRSYAERRKKRREDVIFYCTRSSAKKKIVGFDLTKEWIKERLDNGLCELSGMPFDMDGKNTPDSPSIDRINPFGGYTKDNCRIVLWCINRALFIYGEDYMLKVFKACIEKKSKFSIVRGVA